MTAGVRIVGLISLVLALLLFAANIQRRVGYSVDHAHAKKDCKHYVHQLPEPKLGKMFHDTLRSAGTYWTAIASLVGILALWGIYEQVISSNKAVSETKRSVDAFVEAERGVIRLIDATMDGGFNAENFYCTFENVGRGLATIRSVTVAYRAVGRATDPIDERLSHSAVFEGRHLMKPGDVLSTGTYSLKALNIKRVKNLGTRSTRIPDDVRASFREQIRERENGIIMATYIVIYETPFGSTLVMRDAIGVDAGLSHSHHPTYHKEVVRYGVS